MDIVNDLHSPQPSLTDYARSICASVAGYSSREHIENILKRFDESYRTRNFPERANLFAESLRFEDPVGVPRANTRQEIEEFFTETVSGGMTLDRQVLERIIIQDEAIEHVVATLRMPGHEPASIRHFLYFRFDSHGHIDCLRAFIDKESVSSQLAS